MNTILCSVPVEAPGAKRRRKQTEGPLPILPKSAITQLNDWATKNGFSGCKFYDIDMLYPSDEEIEKFFIENPADVVGLSAVVSTSYMQVRRLAKIIKKVNQNTLVVCGGYLTAAANTVLKKTEVDICVVGDGEVAWVGILQAMKEHLEKGKNRIDIDSLLKVKGIALLNHDGVLKFTGYGQKLSSCHMHPPNFEYLRSGLLGNDEALKGYFRPWKQTESFNMDDRAYDPKRKPMTASIFTSKGCVAKCTFCQRGSKGYSIYDLDKLDKHLQNLKDNYNVGFINIVDENFASNNKYAREVAELLHKHDLLWSCLGVRVTSVDKNDLIHFKNHGCCNIGFGIETGSQTMLDIMEKKVKVEDTKYVIKSCAEIGLHVNFEGFMVGMPGESLKTAQDSGKLMGELCASIRVPVDLVFANTDLSYAIPLVGTPLYEYGKQLGLVGQTVDQEEEYLEMTSNISQYKRYYINFNGAPTSEFLFWDMLVFLEATRTYLRLMKNQTEHPERLKKFQDRAGVKGTNPHAKLKYKKVQVIGGAGIADVSMSPYFFTNFVKDKVVCNYTIAKLPRWLVYPIIRWGLYLEYLAQKYYFKEDHNIHTQANKKATAKMRIKPEEVDPLKTSQKDRSLRTIVNNKMTKLKQTEEEKTISMLTAGP